MNKFLITLATLVAVAVSGVAYAEGKFGGLLQQIVGAGDDVDGGSTQKFTRFSFSADTTVDNGWTIGGSFAVEYAAAGAGGTDDGRNSAYLPTANSMYVQMDNMTVNIGMTADAVTSAIPRIGAMVPGAGHDGGYAFLFDGGILGSNGVTFAEAYYAKAANRIDVDFASINGFSVGATYTPGMEFSSGTGISRSAHATVTGSHGETTHVAVSYSGEMEGMAYTIGVGAINGNSQSQLADDNTNTNNDLASFTGAIRIDMGNLSMGAHIYDNGDSFGASGDAQKASDAGYTVSATYAMGNITVGIGYAHQEMVRGTRAQANATTLTSAAAGNVREDTVTNIGIGYNMGGGVNTFVQLSSNEHSDGDHATTEVDPQVLFAGISLGF